MVITELIKSQLLEGTIMFAAGLALGMLRQLYSIARKHLRKKAGTGLLSRGLFAGMEVAFWLFAAFVVSEFLYYAAYGDLSFHNFLALLLGYLLWRRVFYDIVY